MVQEEGMSRAVSNWIDPAMYTAEKSDATLGPQVYLLGGSNDPLGQIAACAKMYVGEVVRDLADVTDEERKHYAQEIQKTKLAMPLEAVPLHFMIEGVTRGFTHQMVRQRTAAYAQESTRFAVKEDLVTAVALPPSLAGTISKAEWLYEQTVPGVPLDGHDYKSFIETFASPEQKKRFEWDEAVAKVGEAYNHLVDSGMPAEDARGLMPTNITTRLNYITNLRGLLDHAGNRLCTQAQFEWRVVFAQIANALRTYGKTKTYALTTDGITDFRSSAWQYEVIAGLLKPVCYQIGKCAFGADFDRACSIRSRVNANAKIGRASSKWDGTYVIPSEQGTDGSVPVVEEHDCPVFIGAIQPREWLMDPAAAR